MIGQAVSEKMFEYYDHKHVYNTGGRGRQPPGDKMFS